MNRSASAALLSIGSNSVLIVLKLAVGLVSGSVSIVSEAIHSSMDLAASVVAFISIRLARRPADERHAYGHGKMENVSGVVEGVLIFVAAGLIVAESVRKIARSEPVEHLELGVAVMLVSGVVNLIVSKRLYAVARAENSIALEADALHLRTDVYSSFGVGAALLVIVVLQRFAGFPWSRFLDPLAAMAIALFIMKEAWGLLRAAFGPLLDESLSPADLAALERRVASYAGTAMHDVRTRRSGWTKHIDFHLSVPEAMTVKQAHEICDEIERGLEHELKDTSVLIHLEPSLELKASRGALRLSKDELEERLGKLCRDCAGFDLFPHHLHLFDGGAWTELTFHVGVEGSTTVADAHALASRLEARVKAELGYEATVHVEPRG